LKAYPYVIIKVWLKNTTTNGYFYTRVRSIRTGITAGTSTNVNFMHRENLPYNSGYYNYNYYGVNLNYANLFYNTPYASRYIEFHCLTHTPTTTSVAEASWEAQNFYYKTRGPINSSTTAYVDPMGDGTFRRYNASENTAYGGITSFEVQATSGPYLDAYVEIWGKVI